MGGFKDQLGSTLFEHRARRTDPPTSHAAARSSMIRGAWYQDIYNTLKLQRDGGTCYEIADSIRLAYASQITHVDVARRMKKLEGGGWVRRTTKTRPSPGGDQCTVWEAI